MNALPIGELVEPVRTWNPAQSPELVFEYVDLGAVNSNAKQITAATRVAGAEAPSRARQLIAAGDILVSTVRPNLNAVAQVPHDFHGATASTGFTVLRPGRRIDGRFLFHWVRSNDFISDMVRKATGASYPAVSDRIVKESRISLPSLAEQGRIAAILDHADALRAKRRQVLGHLDALTQSIFHEMFGHSEADIELGTVCTRVTDGTHQSPGWTPSGVPFLFVSNITSGEINMDTQKFISEATWRELTRRTPIEVGDILYSTVGSYGIPVVVRTSEPFAFQRHIAHLKPDAEVLLPDFLAAQLASPALKRQARRAARGIAQPTVNLADIKRFRIVLPTVSRQCEFSERVTHIDLQRRETRRVQVLADELFISLQSQAFKGEL